MSKDEFKKEVEEFWYWTSSEDRPIHVWFLALAGWATARYNDNKKASRV